MIVVRKTWTKPTRRGTWCELGELDFHRVYPRDMLHDEEGRKWKVDGKETFVRNGSFAIVVTPEGHNASRFEGSELYTREVAPPCALRG